MPAERSLTEARRLIDALQQPQAYPHPTASIQLIETHISWILLTGPFVYKIKKPVDLGFLDYSSLARRERFCHEEVRLNRRLAPEFYLGVVPIAGSLDAPRVNGDGPPLEFAVQMRPFPQAALLPKALERGELTAAHIDLLAAEIARFHAEASVVPANRPEGDPDSVWEPVQTNFVQLEQNLPDSRSVLVGLREWARREWEAHRDDFLQRKADGLVRECHGDLHLGNMFLHEGRVVLFDGIEFNDSLRLIDVLSDLAFAVMDLQDRGKPAFAWRLLNGYLERAGDYRGLRVLRHYLAYRAMVRAKVASIRLRQPDLEAAARQRTTKELQGYLRLAGDYSTPPRPRLLITHGLSGSGKTTLTQPLLETLGAVRIRSDIERKRMFGMRPVERDAGGIAEGIYAPEATDRTYARLEELAETVLQAGWSVIVDAAFLEPGRRERFRVLAARLGLPFAILDFTAPAETLRERVRLRSQAGTDASDADLAVLEHQLQHAKSLDDQALVVSIDTTADDAAERLIAAVSRFNGD